MSGSSAATGVEMLWPGNQVPVCCLLDDPTPGRNPLWYERPDAGLARDIPNSFTQAFVDMVERTGARGKFSVVPIPGGTGRIDQAVPGVTPEDLAVFLAIVRERIQPTWSVGPEMLTHNRAYDLATGGLLEEREDAWGSHQSAETLTPYISLALQILRNVGLDPTGVTSPWQFGIEVEDAYNTATEIALRRVCSVSVGWYFVRADQSSPTVPPRLMRCDRESRTALVSLVCCDESDFAWRTQFGEPPRYELHLTADGSSGRLAELFPRGEPLVFHTHWQSLYANGSGAGLAALEELITRINRHFGKGIRWMSGRELTMYTVARASTTVRWSADGRTAELDAPFPCRDFTLRLPRRAGGSRLILNGTPLEEIPDGEALVEGTWRAGESSALVCLELRGGDRLTWE